jgi:hypothetical protein
VTPYTDLLDGWRGGRVHRGGPRWPDWSSQTAARHCRKGQPVDDEPAEAEPKSTLEGPVAWGGPIYGHFGHWISEFTSRLLPTLAEMPDVRFAHSMREDFCDRWASWDEAPAFFRGILEWYGIAGDRVELITEPTLVERLVVAPQAEQFRGPGPEPWYLDLLDAHTRMRLGEVEQSGSLYVSRAGVHARFAGEAYLEHALAASGVTVVRPEDFPLGSLNLLRDYASAEDLIFAAGSAIHSLQLMGRTPVDVTVLKRWPGGRPFFDLPLEPRVRSLRYVDVIRGLVHGLELNGQPAPYCGISLLDPEKLRAVLPIDDAWDQKAFDAAVEADVEEWLKKERTSPRWAVPGSAELIDESLRGAGLI